MSVIVIGNRAVGKTSMIVTLAKGTKNVKVVQPNADRLIERFSNPETGEIAATFEVKDPISLSLSVNLPSGKGQEFEVRWIDTPGELWSNLKARKSNPQEWKKLIETVSKSKAVLLLLPPYLYRSKPLELEEGEEPEELDPQTWKTQLKNGLEFLRNNCPYAQHLLIAIHKADLFSNNLDEDEKNWQYNPDKPFRWSDYDEHIRKTYFDLAYDIIREHNSQPPYLSPQFFVTTIYQPNLLELPWVYLGSHLAHVYNV